MRRKRVPAPESTEIEVFAKGGQDGDFGGEDIRGADGQPIYPGRTVKRPKKFVESMGVTAPERHGKARRLYRKAEGGPVIVETENGHHFYAGDCVRSAKGEAAEREHRRLLAVNEAGKTGRKV
jgi:hypothetical protein